MSKVDLNIIKLGGSIITCDSEEGLFDAANTRRLGRELMGCQCQCLLVHGTGLVGKRPAREYDYVDDGIIPADRAHVAIRVKMDMRDLSRRFVRELSNVGIPVVPLCITDYFTESQNGLHGRSLTRGLRSVLAGGGVPVFRGDLAPRKDGSFQVLSSDTIVAILARALRPDSVFLLTDVPGVFAEARGDLAGHDEVLSVLTPENLTQIRQLETDSRDVSRGMAAKARSALQIARWARRCAIASGTTPGLLSQLLLGEEVPCTWVIPQGKRERE